jgi:hypothetical protein
VPVVRLSDETWAALKKWAEPLEDSPDDVIRRLLEFVERASDKALSDARRHGPRTDPAPFDPARIDPARIDSERRPLRRTRGVTPQREFREPVLDALVELGGGAPAKRVLELVEHHMRSVMTEGDYEELRSGGPRWHKAANWARYVLARDGLVQRNSPRGTWELTDEGFRDRDQSGSKPMR